MKVFISYTLKDGEVQERLLKEIDAIGSWKNIELFIDKLHNDDFDPQIRIEKEIQNSDVFILIGSKRVFQSDWVKKEVILAREKNLPIYIVKPCEIVNTLKSIYNQVNNA